MGHPENILRKEICDIFCSKIWQEAGVQHIFVDEAHCDVNWGKDFRPDFTSISKLRAVFPKAYMVALTATATLTMQKEIVKILCISKNYKSVSASVDRSNITLNVIKRLPTSGGLHSASDSFEKAIHPIIQELCDDPINAKRTIVYCKLKWCGYGYEMACREATKFPETSKIVDAVSQFHAPCTSKVSLIREYLNKYEFVLNT